MSDERDKILAMVEEGTISAEEANELLEALDESDGQESEAPADFSWPDMPQRGQAYQPAFNVALLGSMIGGFLLLITRKSSGFMGFIHRFIFWPFTVFAILSTIIAYLTKDSPWLHIRVQSEGNPEFKISLPFPADALNKALNVARTRAPNADVQEKIDAAAEILAEMDTSNLKDPLVINISDEGDSVQVYLN